MHQCILFIYILFIHSLIQNFFLNLIHLIRSINDIVLIVCQIFSGIEKEYEQRVLPDGKLNVDGFLCVFDVSQVPNRSLERQVELTASILNNCLKTKRPVVLVTTKNDEANEVTSNYFSVFQSFIHPCYWYNLKQLTFVKHCHNLI